jgi:acyl carrier protein phosphodiesterase
VNFLAHIYLSGNDEKLAVGNFIADFVKGQAALATYEPAIVKGIELHRAIDYFTDNHAIVKISKARLSGKYRHYSGVIVDMFYDHFLALDWDHYHAINLRDFSRSIYLILNSHHSILPTRAAHMLPYMEKHDWLVSYGTVEGIHRALSGMAKRTPYESKMDEAVTDLSANYELFHQEFSEFFPELEKHCHEWLSSR